ncbi:MAG: ferric reductase-like transmembrane domain-containing protein [Woeseiaceae bacterium]|nr:ferric reductase-like transmembrane domain-containing protein [Woeseiaceae bacterium]
MSKSRNLLWAALALPVAIQTYRYSAEGIYYGEYLHWTGIWATYLLLATLAVTPLRLVFGAAEWMRWIGRHRRDLGVASFAYATAHAVAYVVYKADFAMIVDEALSAGMLTGWIALLLFLPLALTSNDYSVRRLKKRWKTLHRLVYVAALLTLAHWVLTAFDPTTGYFALAILVVLLLMRVVRPVRRPPAGSS